MSKHIEYLESLFKETYKYENEKKEKHFASLTVALAGIGLAGTAISFLSSRIQKLPYDLFIIHEWFAIIIFVLFLFSVLLLLLTVYEVFGIIDARQYGYLPGEAELIKYADELKQWYIQQDLDDVEGAVLFELRLHIVLKYAEVCEKNRALNARKIISRLRAIRYVIISAVIAFLAIAAIFVRDAIRSLPEPQHAQHPAISDANAAGADASADIQRPATGNQASAGAEAERPGGTVPDGRGDASH